MGQGSGVLSECRFIGDDPEGGERLDGVAGVWRRAAARLIGPAPHSAPLARLCRQAMTWGLAPVRTWEPSFGEGGVAEIVQAFSIAQCPRM